jgi:hypothetical protein
MVVNEVIGSVVALLLKSPGSYGPELGVCGCVRGVLVPALVTNQSSVWA